MLLAADHREMNRREACCGARCMVSADTAGGGSWSRTVKPDFAFWSHCPRLTHWSSSRRKFSRSPPPGHGLPAPLLLSHSANPTNQHWGAPVSSGARDLTSQSWHGAPDVRDVPAEHVMFEIQDRIHCWVCTYSRMRSTTVCCGSRGRHPYTNGGTRAHFGHSDPSWNEPSNLSLRLRCSGLVIAAPPLDRGGSRRRASEYPVPKSCGDESYP